MALLAYCLYATKMKIYEGFHRALTLKMLLECSADRKKEFLCCWGLSAITFSLYHIGSNE